MWIWPGEEGTKKKPVLGNFANHLYIVETESPKTGKKTKKGKKDAKGTKNPKRV